MRAHKKQQNEKRTEITETQLGALYVVSNSAYTADGTKIAESTGQALWRKGLVFWSDAGQKWNLTAKGKKVLENN